MTRTLLFIFLFCTTLVFAQDIKSPSEFLGYDLGTQFTRHHEVVDYYKYLAEAMPQNMQLTQYGSTNERRPLLLAFVSTKENMANLEQIRSTHMQSTTGSSNAKKAIVWLSYNVHGNESVSTEASMQTIYDVLTKKQNLLEETVLIIDPCINPDGRDRYVNWYNENKNSPFTVDPNSKEHHEGWLNGRANHYMFDLNRDWAWLTQKESQQRIKVYNQWLPHVHVDFHEQGVDSPYYFAPAAEPFHEVITDFQREFQVTIGKNHAKYFDANGWFYFTKEVFDLLYPSYGDTYPMYNGGIGMTYEQGGSGRAGLGITTSNGDTLTLNDRIAHHYTTGISTIEVASQNVARLNTEFQKFYETKDFKYKTYALNGNADKIKALTQLLDQHNITYEKGGKGLAKGFNYNTQKNGVLPLDTNSLLVSTDQTKGTLVKVLFEPNAKLSDSLTYDITAWSLPFAYGLDAVASTNKITGLNTVAAEKTSAAITAETFAYIAGWKSMNDARFLAALHQAKIKVRVARKPFTVDGKIHDRGSLIITKSDNKNNADFVATLQDVVKKHEITLHAASTGFVSNGQDFGSRSVRMLAPAKVAVLSNGPTSTLRFGEIWHFFEQQLHYPVSVISNDYFSRIDLWDYDVLIFPDGGDYSKTLTKSNLSVVKRWVKDGGKLIAMGSAISTLEATDGFSIKKKEIEKDSAYHINLFETTQRDRIKEAITGAIFKTQVDVTHPLAYGYTNSYHTLKESTSAYEYLKDSGNVVYLEALQNKPVAGFAGSEAVKTIDQTLIYGVENYGNGQVIYMVDNPLFRGFWENGKLFFANALFMVD